MRLGKNQTMNRIIYRSFSSVLGSRSLFSFGVNDLFQCGVVSANCVYVCIVSVELLDVVQTIADV